MYAFQSVPNSVEYSLFILALSRQHLRLCSCDAVEIAYSLCGSDASICNASGIRFVSKIFLTQDQLLDVDWLVSSSVLEDALGCVGGRR